MVAAGRLYGRRAAGGAGCCWGWGSVYYDLDGGGSVLPACSSLFPLLPSPALLCWTVSRRLDGMPGRVQAGRLLGDRRRLSGWGGAGRLQAAGVGAGAFYASASLPLSVSLCVLCCWPCLCPSGRVAVCAHAGQGLRVLGVLCGCASAGAGAGWARLPWAMLGSRSGRRAHGKMHNFKAVSLAIFRPQKIS